ncbi:MAG: hypothetical protein HYX79_07260 [Chloroflexi bacterium]|nr:hypothetical protein [Chloroflexota bacterium]
MDETICLRIRKRANRRVDWLAIGLSFMFIAFVPGSGKMNVLQWLALAIGVGIIIWALTKPLAEEIPSFQEAYKKASIVWGLWHSGGRTREQGFHVRYDSLKRILILDPYTAEFTNGTLFEGYFDTPKRAKIDICVLTREAVAKGISVRWYTKMQSVIYTIFNPENNDAWLVAEEHRPNVPRDDRPRKILKKERNKAEFLSIVDKYESLWRLARTPLPVEYSLEAQNAGNNQTTK